MNLAFLLQMVNCLLNFELKINFLLELQRTLLDLSYRVMSFDRFVDAIDQNILILTEEFVSRIILG